MKLSRSDLAVSAAVLLGAAGLTGLFFNDLNAAAAPGGGTELGTVVFRKLSATRKAPAGFGWERMQNNTPVYDADTLRTADFSEASIFFDDGTSLDMQENSMLKLDFGRTARTLEFLSGEFGIGSNREATSYTISSSAGKIDLEKGTRAVFTREADTLSVELSQGKARLVAADGSSRAIEQLQELQVNVKSGQATIVARPIIPVTPVRNGRFLSFTESGKAPVEFTWQPGVAQPGTRQSAGAESWTLELSQAKDFSEGLVSAAAAQRHTRLELPAGTWYWRVRDRAGQESPVRRFSLETAAAPAPAYPREGQRHEFRRIKPAIHFAWSAMESASSYLFEIAADPGFAKPAVRLRTATPAITVDSLGEGDWHWRVSPIHALTVLGKAPEQRSSSFTIVRKAAMAEPASTAPFDGSMYQIQDIDGKGLDFSWAPEAEAVSYELVLSNSRDLSAPVARIASAKPYLHLAGPAAAALARAGNYYWGVRWIDSEGNASPPSARRQLLGIDGSIAVRLSFPPDDYRIADSFIRNTRFTWKSNVNARTEFQLARDPGFQKTVYQETVSADTLIGRNWPSGRYYWRLRTFNVDGTVFLETSARSFSVVDPFPGPLLTKPSGGGHFYLKEHDQAQLAWTPVAGADYYNLTLRSAADRYGSVIFERTLLEQPRLACPLGELPSGQYRISIQAFALSSDSSTRIIGYIGDSDFSYRRLTQLELASPAEGEHVDGLEARKGRTAFSYRFDETPDSSEIIVSADPEGKHPVGRSGRKSGVGRLDPGVYYWTASASLAGIDVSATERRRFVVDIPPPPPPPALASPVDAAFYVLRDLDGKGLEFAWSPEAEAVAYELILSRSADLAAPAAVLGTDQPRLRINGRQAAALAQGGAWYWGVRWRSAENDLSTTSPARRLEGVDADNAVRASFPPDGYRLAESLVSANRFSWTTAIAARTVFQVSRSPDFHSLIHEEAPGAPSCCGRAWPCGRYFWRLRTLNTDDSVLMDSPPRSFEVVAPLPGPALLKPAPSGTCLLRENDQATLSWTAVEGADSYELALRPADADDAPPLLQHTVSGGTSLSWPLGDLPSGAYRLSLQAVASAGAGSTRLPGRTVTSVFNIACIPYIRLEGPSRGEHLDGLAARRGGAVFRYRLGDRTENASLVLSSETTGARIGSWKADRSGRTAVRRLDPGAYAWTVTGAADGFDVSARESQRFVVDPPEPLPAPALTAPEPDRVFGPEQLRAKRSITFAWTPVRGATAYRLAIFQPGRKDALFVREKITATSFTLEDLASLDKGGFSWAVQAQSWDERGELEQPGREARSGFTIDLPSVRKPKPDSGKKLYGK